MEELVIFLLWAGTYLSFWWMYFSYREALIVNRNLLESYDHIRLQNEDLRKQLQAYKAGPIIMDLRAALH